MDKSGRPFCCSLGYPQTPNGLSRLSAWSVALGIDLERGRPAQPQDNGGHERLHCSIAEELECLGQGATAEELELWREQFNHERPHEALGMRCPAELYRDSTRRYSKAEVQLSYPGMTTRLVDKNGKFSWKQQKVFISGSLAACFSTTDLPALPVTGPEPGGRFETKPVEPLWISAKRSSNLNLSVLPPEKAIS
jgi:putative transposase